VLGGGSTWRAQVYPAWPASFWPAVRAVRENPAQLLRENGIG